MQQSPALIYGLTRTELKQVCLAWGQPEFRAEQIWQWLYIRRVNAWQEMSNVSAAVRQKLAADFILEAASLLRATEEQPAGGARKLLLALRDGARIETVIIPAPKRTTLCVSSQVGCRFKCAFCASGQAGFRRQLQPAEMVGQVLVAARLLGHLPTHLVWMGIGEPLDNYDAVLQAVRILNDPHGVCIGARRMTISTCGIVPAIRRLAAEGLQLELSVSLHAPEDALRSRLMPVNRIHPLAELITACREYTAQTKRIITFEYTLIRDLNDSPAQAGALVRLLRGLPCRVNLIPLSAVAEFAGEPAPVSKAIMFIAELERAGINATLRVSKGAEVQAACGQLRLATLADEPASALDPASTDML